MCRKPSPHGSGRPGFPVKQVVPNEYGNYAIFLELGRESSILDPSLNNHCFSLLHQALKKILVDSSSVVSPYALLTIPVNIPQNALMFWSS
jgi:hypothetical protein